MCTETDAERHVKLATLQEKSGETRKASANYLEASSIYLLQYNHKKLAILLEYSRNYYNRAREVLGKDPLTGLNSQELAKKTLEEAKPKTNDLIADIKKIIE